MDALGHGDIIGDPQQDYNEEQQIQRAPQRISHLVVAHQGRAAQRLWDVHVPDKHQSHDAPNRIHTSTQ